jgi:hypothetical protein
VRPNWKALWAEGPWHTTGKRRMQSNCVCGSQVSLSRAANRQRRNAAPIIESVDERPQPRLHLLVARGFDPDVGTGAEGGDKERRLPRHTGDTVVDGDRRASPVDEGFLSGLVLLAHHHVEFLATAIQLAEAADTCCNTCPPLCGGRIYVAN